MEKQAIIDALGGEHKDTILEAMQEAGYNPILKDDLDATIENRVKSQIDVKIKERDSEHWNSLDGIFKESLGLDKVPGVQTTEGLKKYLSGLTQSKSDLESQIEKLKSGKIDEATAQKISDLEKQLVDKDSNFQSKLSEKDKEYFNNLFDIELNYAKKSLVKAENITDSLYDMVYKSALADVMSEERAFRDGKIVFLDENGNVQTNPENNSNPYTLAEKMAAKMADVLDGGEVQKGIGGPKKPAPKGNDGLPVLPGDVKSTIDFTKWIEDGIQNKNWDSETVEKLYAKHREQFNGYR